MESNFNKETLIDDLIAGRLSDEQASEAFNKLQGDPALTSDYKFQQELIDQLQAVRKTELKMRLDAVPIEPVLIGGLTASALLKYGGAALTASVISVGAYLYVTSPSDADIESLDFISSKNTLIDLSSTSPSQGPDEIVRFELKGIQSLPLTASTEAIPLIEVKEGLSTEKVISELEAPEVTPPAVTELFEEEEIASPELDSNPDRINKLSTKATEIENVQDKKYPFHYKYHSNKLYLYGDFKGIPYEIIEVHGKSGRVTYLAYEGKFYQLKNPVKGVRPLIPIGDKALIQELEILKEEKAF